VQFVKGVGPRLGAVFNHRDIHNVRDLLFFFPRAYEDRTKLSDTASLVDGAHATIGLRVVGSRQIPVRSGRFRNILEVRCTDDKGTMLLKWFHAPRGMHERFKAGAQFIATGTVKIFMGRAEMVHPEITWGASLAAAASPEASPLEAATQDFGRVVPIYTEIEGVSSRLLRKVLWEALEKFSSVLTEDLPEPYLRKHGLPALARAVREIHFPPETGASIPDLIAFNTAAHARLIYEEFFKFQYLVLKQRLRAERAFAQSFGPESLAAVARVEKLLPFTLTGDQQRSVREILHDLGRGAPMNRLIQGDVGSGKTAVAFLVAAGVLAEGGQAALMAPTEILAEQHYKNAVRMFGGILNVFLLTGKTPQSERARMFARSAAGEPVLMIGTHALIENPVVFKNLALVMIDEQHRFGVEQRRTLRRKGMRVDPVTGKALHAHALILTATPIPRTLALTAYGELSVTQIKEMPPGRSPIVTRIIRSEQADKARAYERIRAELKAGRQAYFIFPLVNESEAEGFTQLKSAVAEAERLATEVFPEFKVALLHGQMKSEEKAAVMQRFARNEAHILVSTTVVEVGVDVPNATIMAVEHAERFGLSQLHQLRGRVGRGAHQSYCFLFTHAKVGQTTEQRLEVLEETTDGFKIAEADLEIRGPGEFLGTRQAGGLPFRLANLVRDREWLLKAHEDASEVLRADPDLASPENARLKRYFDREGQLQWERFKTS
jgi:ATP-dependent DNA helicase RecG